MTTIVGKIPESQIQVQDEVLLWAVEKRVEASVSFSRDAQWITLRTNFLRYDAAQGVLQIEVCRAEADSAASLALPNPGDKIGVSFRRGHKKCLFVSTLMMIQPTGETGDCGQTLVLRVPKQLRSVQRRAYQRIVVPEGVFIAAKIWEGGVPVRDSMAWPICSGRLANISMGGALIESRVDQNPRLSSGEIVGIEIMLKPGMALVFDGMFRHCVATGNCRIGLGFHFPALEHELPGRSTIDELSSFISRVRAMPG